jgi:hypothetical protein
VDFIDKLNELVRKAESDLKKLQVSWRCLILQDELIVRAKELGKRGQCRASWIVWPM